MMKEMRMGILLMGTKVKTTVEEVLPGVLGEQLLYYQEKVDKFQ